VSTDVLCLVHRLRIRPLEGEGLGNEVESRPDAHDGVARRIQISLQLRFSMIKILIPGALGSDGLNLDVNG
jgi:hypothetical protein